MNSLLDTGEDQPVIDENKDYFSELVGEGKKFKDEKELAKGKAFSDAHIKVLESRFDSLSDDHRKALDELRARASLEDLITKLESKQQPSSRDNTPNSNEDIKPTLGLDDIDAQIAKRITEREQARKEEDNFNKVQAKLEERLGNNFKSVLKEKSQSLGLSQEEVDTMARKNPNLFFKTFDLNETRGDGFQPPPRGSSFVPKAETKRGWSYYQKLKKDNPMAWMDTKTAIQMEKDAQAMGLDAFYAS